VEQDLTPEQQIRVEVLVREKGEKCEVCGKADLRCGKLAAAYPGGGFTVHLWCPNLDAKAHDGGLGLAKVGLLRDYSITPEEARRVGLS
jgi:hypothetical protein